MQAATLPRSRRSAGTGPPPAPPCDARHLMEARPWRPILPFQEHDAQRTRGKAKVRGTSTTQGSGSSSGGTAGAPVGADPACGCCDIDGDCDCGVVLVLPEESTAAARDDDELL